MVVDCANELGQRSVDVYFDLTSLFKNASKNARSGSLRGPKEFTDAYLASLEPSLVQRTSTTVRNYAIQAGATAKHAIKFV